jgi:hypothetical protein
MVKVATLNPATMEILQLFRGDTIIVRYDIYCFVLLEILLTCIIAVKSGAIPF